MQSLDTPLHLVLSLGLRWCLGCAGLWPMLRPLLGLVPGFTQAPKSMSGWIVCILKRQFSASVA